RSWREPEDLVRRLNRKLRGWANYFRLGSVSKAYSHVDRYVEERLCQWWRRKYKKSKGRTSRFSYLDTPKQLGLVRLKLRPRYHPLGASMNRCKLSSLSYSRHMG